MGIETKTERSEPTKRGVFFLVFEKDKVLLEKRIKPGKAYFGYTIIPGGGVEDGESYEEAMIREAGEELGIKPTKFVMLD